ncbi:hypothetical protein O6H91_08G076200 [Diphasiastrum complanatum]|uniref:Uncharacterized protein n=1 Tax=Diphasiastrum complanatum TaxID=34168 RepID=A0ACC2CZ93_DIPCM|nr:hypothetical protein O6H91_08G076200 [Diphasiastrum complanatum]
MADLAGIVNVNEYEILAKQRLPKMVYDYYASGAEDEWSLKENRRGYESIRFRPRVLVDVSNVDTSINVLGFKISTPIMVAPTAMLKMAHPDGELAVARAAAAAGTIMTLSSNSTCSMEEVAETGPGLRFFQLYVFNNRNFVVELVHRAELSGYKAIVVTVDTPRLGRREADIRNRFDLPPHLTMKNLEKLNTMSSKRVRTLGLETPSSSRGSVVSQKDRSLTWKILSAVEDQIPVFVDGGVRRGTDVLKAMALGSAGVFVGRPAIFGLAVDGESGVKHVLELLRQELELAMSLVGCSGVKGISRSHVQTTTDRRIINSKI